MTHRKADAYQYPKEKVDPLPSYLKGISVVDFGDALEKVQRWFRYLHMAYGEEAFQQYGLLDMYKEFLDAWHRWKELQPLAMEDRASHKEIHLLEKKMDQIMHKVWRWTRDDEIYNLARERVDQAQKDFYRQVESSTGIYKESWHREADDKIEKRLHKVEEAQKKMEQRRKKVLKRLKNLERELRYLTQEME